jgi:hypothetical protein
VIERILAFDANKDGKVTKDELPERMQDLLTRGDTNNDGALDRDEIAKLAADMAREQGPVGRGPRGRGGPGGRGDGRGGPRGRGGPDGGFAADVQGRGGRGRGGPPGLPPGAIEQAVADLGLTEGKKETANAAVKAHHDNLRTMTQLARADLLLQMNGILSEGEYRTFKTALDRLPTLGEPPPGRGGRRGGPPGS